MTVNFFNLLAQNRPNMNLTKRILLACTLVASFVACDDDETPATRTYRMGFQNSAPRFDSFEMAIKSLNMWTPRADAAMITTEVPWEELLAGDDVVDYVVEQYKGLVEFYRQKNLQLWVYIDPANGLNRGSDAGELVEAGRSMTEVEIQNIYRRFSVVMDSVLKPDHLGLCLETNLIRAASTTELYNAIKQAVNLAAQDIIDRNSNAKLSVSLQAEAAWGRFVGNGYQGVAQDFIDFPFIEEVGISSYPYFGFNHPDEIPMDYYSRMVEGKSFPVFITEGGWTSESVTTNERTFVSSKEHQKRYIEKHGELLDAVKAKAVFQLSFTDIDVDALPPGLPENLPYFAYTGVVDKNYERKPAYDAWDALFDRQLIE
jgi:hypothetical protein